MKSSTLEPVRQGSRSAGSAGVAVESARPLLGRALLILLSSALLTLALAPVHMAMLAWVALVPWMLAIRTCRSIKGACLTGFLGGVACCAPNLWWLWVANISGTIALILYFALYWGLAAGLFRVLVVPGLAGNPALHGVGTLLCIPLVWTAAEWLRAYLIPGFPWLLLGYSQSWLTVLCQVADAGGVSAVSFWVASINGMVFLAVVRRRQLQTLVVPALATLGLLLGVLGYGVIQLRQAPDIPGPSILIVQTNHRHLRGGTPTVSRQMHAAAHLDATRRELAAHHPDLVVWSEVAMPPLNAEGREQLQSTEAGRFMEETHRQIGALAAAHRTTIVTGANYVGGWTRQDGARVAGDRRNSAYCYGPDGRQCAERYDKTQLVPFSEKVAFQSVPVLGRIMLWLSPPRAADPLMAGDPDRLTRFQLQRAAATEDSLVPESSAAQELIFVTPICLENIYPDYIASVVRPDAHDGRKADFIVNLSNDGWFHSQERWQHWQNITLRCIENRVPMARSSNTGISGFIDSCGRTLEMIPPRQEGTRLRPLPLDDRVSVYSRWGEWFGRLCVLATGLLVGVSWWSGRQRPALR